MTVQVPSLALGGPVHAAGGSNGDCNSALVKGIQSMEKLAPRRTSAVLRVLGRRLLLPLCLGLLDQALLAGIFTFGLGVLSSGGDRRLVVETVDETGNEGRIAQNLDGRRERVNLEGPVSSQWVQGGY